MIGRRRLFVLPDRAPCFTTGEDYAGTGAPSYSAYNYFTGAAARAKRRHFEIALRVARPHFGGTAIDYGCADGIFLPSLARYFRSVWAVDRHLPSIQSAQRVVEHYGLENVAVTCNEDGGLPSLPASLEGGADVLFLLETLEHVGVRERMWESRADFLAELFLLLGPSGQIVVSVPNMIGPAFLVQRAALRTLGLERERRLSRGELWRAVLRADTTALEERWKAPHGHLGFNHRRLEEALSRRFAVVRRRHLFFQVIYVLERRAGHVTGQPAGT